MSTIMYLHGFGSFGNDDLGRQLKARFPARNVVTPNLPLDGYEAVDLVDVMLNATPLDETITMVGISLGAFYARYIAQRRPDVSALLINPLIEPYHTLGPLQGRNTNFGTGESFLWGYDNIEVLRRMTEAERNYNRNQTVIVAADDETVSPIATCEYFTQRGVPCYVYPDGGHKFTEYETVFEFVELCR